MTTGMPQVRVAEPDPIRVGFVLLSSVERPIPSTRIAALNMFPWMERSGLRIEVLHAPAQPCETPALSLSATQIAASGVRAVVFQKVHGPSVVRLARDLERSGVRTVFMVCDVVDPEMCDATSATVAVTDFLRSLYPLALQDRIHVVHDAIERPEVVARVRDFRATTLHPLRAVLVTSGDFIDIPVFGVPPPWVHVTVVGDYPDDADRYGRLRRWSWALQRAEGAAMRLTLLRALAHPRIRRVRWTPQRVYNELAQADIGLIPVDMSSTSRTPMQPVPSWEIKSENRLTLKMSVGLPVVAAPIPAYREVLQHEINGLFASTTSEWLAALERLRDPALRARLAAAARSSVIDRFSQKTQSGRLASLLRSLVSPSS